MQNKHKTILPHIELNLEEKELLKRGVANIIPHLVKISIITSFLFTSAGKAVLATTITPQEIIQEVNAIRQEYNIPPLRENHLLTLAAYEKAEDMARNKYFAHTSPTGIPFYYWIEQKGYLYTFAGENLAKNFTSTKQLIKAWMESPTHKENITDPDFCDIGIATRKLPQEGTLVVEFFGCRKYPPLPTESQSQTQTGYRIQPQSPTVTIKSPSQKTLSDPSSNPPFNQKRMQTTALLTLAAVLALSINNRRYHYHHVYKIPVRKVNKNSAFLPAPRQEKKR